MIWHVAMLNDKAAGLRGDDDVRCFVQSPGPIATCKVNSAAHHDFHPL